MRLWIFRYVFHNKPFVCMQKNGKNFLRQTWRHISESRTLYNFLNVSSFFATCNEKRFNSQHNRQVSLFSDSCIEPLDFLSIASRSGGSRALSQERPVLGAAERSYQGRPWRRRLRKPRTSAKTSSDRSLGHHEEHEENPDRRSVILFRPSSGHDAVIR